MRVLSANRVSQPTGRPPSLFRRPPHPRMRFCIPNAEPENEETPNKPEDQDSKEAVVDTVTDTVKESPKIERKTVVQEEAGSAAGLFEGGLFEKGMDPRLFGENVDPDVPLPPEFEADIWENPKFEYFVPVLVVAGLVVGGIAAKSFNEGATSYLQPATSEDEAEIVPAQAPDSETVQAPAPE